MTWKAGSGRLLTWGLQQPEPEAVRAEREWVMEMRKGQS